MDIVEFDNWSKEKGITSNALIQQAPYAGYGLYSSQDINNDSLAVLVHIPENTILTSHNALKADSQFSQGVLDIIQEMELLLKNTENERMIICLFLVYCKFFKTVDTWKPYIDVLPKVDFFKENHVLFNSDCITGTNLENSVKSKLSKLERELEDIVSIAQRLEENSMNWLSSIQLEMYIWSDCIFWSRVVGIGGDKDIEESISSDMALIPYFDFANHSSDKSNIRWKRNKENHGIDLINNSNESIFKGQELLLSYGSKPNQELLFLHGFCIENNQKHSQVTLPLLPFLNPANGLYNLQKIHWLKQLGAKPILTFIPDEKDSNLLVKCGWTFDSIAIMFLVALDEDDDIGFSKDHHEQVFFTLAGKDIKTLEELSNKVKTLDMYKVIELRAACLLLDALEYHYSLNIENEHTSESILWKHASIYRAEEKESLEMAIHRLSNIRDDLMQDSTVLTYLESMQQEEE